MKLNIIAVILLIYFFLIIVEAIPLYKKNKFKKFIIYILLIAVSLLLNIIMALEIDIPSPAIWIKNVITMLFGSSLG